MSPQEQFERWINQQMNKHSLCLSIREANREIFNFVLMLNWIGKGGYEKQRE